MDCFHHCRAGAGGGHFWSHEIVDPGIKIDPYRLYCDFHASEIADRILAPQITQESLMNESLKKANAIEQAKGRALGRNQNLAESESDVETVSSWGNQYGFELSGVEAADRYSIRASYLAHAEATAEY